MIPIYRYMDSHPFQKNQTPFNPFEYPSMESVPSYMTMDPAKSCMPSHDSGRNYWRYGYPMPPYSCCNGGDFFPGYYNFRPSHLPVPPHQHTHSYGRYPPFPEPYCIQYVPPTHYSLEQPRYEFDKNMMRNHHCCGCPNSLCGKNQKEYKCVKIEEEKQDNQRKGSLVPFQNNQSSIVWIPPDYMGREREREPSETGTVKQEKERHGSNLESVEQAPKFWNGWPLSDLSCLGSWLPDADGMGTQSVRNMQQEDGKKEFPFPVFWMPARKTEAQNIGAPRKHTEEPSSVGKFVPTNILQKDDATSEGPEVVKTINQSNIPEMDMNCKTEDANKKKERRCIPVETVKDNEERELSRNNVKGQSSSSPKKSRLPPVCLRVDPLPKKKNGHGSSRSQSSPKSTVVKKSSRSDSKINNATAEPDSEKIIKAREVKTHESTELLSLPTQPQPQDNFFDKLCKEESTSEEYREKDRIIRQTSTEKAVDEGLEASSGDLAQEGKNEKPNLSDVEAAMLIQSAYRGYEVRKWELLKKMKQLAEVRQQVIEVQNRVKALELAPQDEKERMFVGEMIMRLLLKLDTIQGLHPSVRESRKSLAKELVALEEKLDCMVIKPTKVVPEAAMENPAVHFDVEAHDDIKEEEQHKDDVVAIGEIFPEKANESNGLVGESHGAQPLCRIDDMAAPADEELQRLTGYGHTELLEADYQNTNVSEAEQLVEPREHRVQNEDTSEISSQNLSNQIKGEEVMQSLIGDKRPHEAESGAETEQNVEVVNNAEKKVGEVLQTYMKEETADDQPYSLEDGQHPRRDSWELPMREEDSPNDIEPVKLEHIEMSREVSEAEENAHDLEVELSSDRTLNKKQPEEQEECYVLSYTKCENENEGASDESAELVGEQLNSNDDLNIQNELATERNEQQTANEGDKVLEDVQHQPKPSSELDNEARQACDESAELLEELSKSYHDKNIQNEMVTEKNEQQTAGDESEVAEDVQREPCVLDPMPSSKLDNHAYEFDAAGEPEATLGGSSTEMGKESLPTLPNASPTRETMDKKLVEESEKMRDMVEKLMEASKEQIAIISKLSGRVKDLETRMSRKKKPRSLGRRN